jgi:hypothetical protein
MVGMLDGSSAPLSNTLILLGNLPVIIEARDGAQSGAFE